MKKEKQQSGYTWVLPKRAPTPLNIAGSNVRWMKTKSTTTKKIAISVRRTSTRDRQHAGKPYSHSTVDERREPELLVDNMRPAVMTDEDRLQENPRQQKRKGVVDQQQARTRESRQDEEFPNAKITKKETDTPPTPGKPRRTAKKTVASGARQGKDSLASNKPRDVSERTVEKKEPDRQVAIDTVQDSGEHIDTQPSPPTTSVQESKTNESGFLHLVSSQFNGFFGDCIGDPEACEHCKRTFQFMETTVCDFTFRRECNVKSNFHPSCQAERALLKKQKEEVLNQIARLGFLRDVEELQRTKSEKQTRARRERSWRRDSARSRSPTKRRESDGRRRTRSPRKAKEDTIGEESQSPLQRRFISKKGDNIIQTANNKIHKTDPAVMDRMNPTSLVKKDKTALLPKNRKNQAHRRKKLDPNEGSGGMTEKDRKTRKFRRPTDTWTH
jgi:hypothetical protein